MEEAHFTQKDRETLGKLSESSAVLESKLDRAIDDIKGLSNNFASKTSVDNIEKRVKSIEDNNKWVVRVVLGIVISAILGLVVVTTREKSASITQEQISKSVIEAINQYNLSVEK